MRTASSLLCLAGTAALAALAATVLVEFGRPEPRVGTVAALEPPRQPPAPSPQIATVEIPLPDLPGPLAGLPGPDSGSDVVAASGSDSLPLRPSVSEPIATGQPDRPGARPGPSPAMAEIVRREVASRDISLSQINVRPPPRPAFLEGRGRPVPPLFEPQGRPSGQIAEIRPPDQGSAWPEPVSAGTWTWSSLPPPAAFSVPDGPTRSGRSLQAGMASWYGPGFHGRKTASGERFDQNAMTAAHRSLPFGTRVRVIDEKTGRSVVVRINDRGPFAHGRIIDLSKGSAQALGMLSTGRVRIVSAEP